MNDILKIIKNLFKKNQPLYGYYWMFKRHGCGSDGQGHTIDEVINECYIEVCLAMDKHKPHPEKWDSFIWTICKRTCYRLGKNITKYEDTFELEDTQEMDEKYPYHLTTILNQEDDYEDEEEIEYMKSLATDIFEPIEYDVIIGKISMEKAAEAYGMSYGAFQQRMLRKKKMLRTVLDIEEKSERKKNITIKPTTCVCPCNVRRYFGDDEAEYRLYEKYLCERIKKNRNNKDFLSDDM